MKKAMKFQMPYVDNLVVGVAHSNTLQPPEREQERENSTAGSQFSFSAGTTSPVLLQQQQQQQYLSVPSTQHLQIEVSKRPIALHRNRDILSQTFGQIVSDKNVPTLLIQQVQEDSASKSTIQDRQSTAQVSANSAERREPLYSHRKGVDVTKLIKQSKEQLLLDRNELIKRSKLAMSIPRQVEPGARATSGEALDLNRALSITQQIKPQLSKVQEEQVRAGLQSVLKRLLYPDLNDQPSVCGPSNVNVEPLNIEFKSSYNNYQTRNSILYQNSQNGTETNRHSQGTRNGSGHASLSFDVKKRLLAEKTRIIYESLGEDQRQQLLKIFSQVPLNDTTSELISQFLAEKHLELKSQVQREELRMAKQEFRDAQRNAELLMGSRQDFEQIRKGFIGKVPLQEPPYTLHYQRERRERLIRMQMGIGSETARQSKKSRQSTSQMPVMSQQSFEKKNSQTDLSPSDAKFSEKFDLKKPTVRLNTQQNNNQRIQARKKLLIQQQLQQQQESFQQSYEFDVASDGCLSTSNKLTTSLLSPKLAVSRARQNRNVNNSVNFSQKNGQNHSILSGPKDKLSKVKIGSKLLFGGKGGQSTRNNGRRTDSRDMKRLDFNQSYMQSRDDDSLFGGNDTWRAAANTTTFQPRLTQQQQQLAYQQRDVDFDQDSILEIDLLSRNHDTSSRIEVSRVSKAQPTSPPVMIQETDSVHFEEQQNKSATIDLLRISQQRTIDSHVTRQKHSAATRNNRSNVSSQLNFARLQQIEEYQKKLIQNAERFDQGFSDASMNEEQFFALVAEHESSLEQTFHRCFKSGPVAKSLDLPPVVLDVLFLLFGGYKTTLQSFGKYSVRLRQKLDYKNERLSKVCQDLRQDMIRQKAYDKFLKKKMEDLQAEMNRINGMIKGFYENSLLGASRDAIKDTFSEVTTSLEAICEDLNQERVPLEPVTTVDLEGSKTDGQKQDAATGEKPAQARVSMVEMVPFAKIRDQIDSNYSEIQMKTLRAVVDRLGLGQQKVETVDNFSQTYVEYVTKDSYNDLNTKLYDATHRCRELDKEINKLVEVITSRDQKVEETSKRLAKAKQRIDEVTEEKREKVKLIDELAEQVDELERDQKRLQTKYDELSKDKRKVDTQVISLVNKTTNLTETVDRLKTEATQHKEELEKYKSGRGSLEAKVKRMEATVADWQKKMDPLKRQLEDLQNQNKELEEENEHLKRVEEAQASKLSALSAKQTELEQNMRRKGSSVESDRELGQESEDSIPPRSLPIQKKQSEPIKSEAKIYKQESLPKDVSQPSKASQSKQEKSLEEVEERESGLSSPAQERTNGPEPPRLILSDQTLVGEQADTEMSLLKQVEQPVVESEIKVNPFKIVEETEKRSEPEQPTESARQEQDGVDASVQKGKERESSDDDADEQMLSSSSVDSEEIQDRIGEKPLDIFNLKQNMKRQATLCPTLPMLNHIACQTQISGPIQPVGALSNMIDSFSQSSALQPPTDQNFLVDQCQQQPIYQFSYHQTMRPDKLKQAMVNNDLVEVARESQLNQSEDVYSQTMNVAEELTESKKYEPQNLQLLKLGGGKLHRGTTLKKKSARDEREARTMGNGIVTKNQMKNMVLEEDWETHVRKFSITQKKKSNMDVIGHSLNDQPLSLISIEDWRSKHTKVMSQLGVDKDAVSSSSRFASTSRKRRGGFLVTKP